MAEKLHDLGHKLTSNVSSAYHGLHGAGEALRGTVNSTMDGLVPNHESREGGGRARNEAVAQKGLDELHGAEKQFGLTHAQLQQQQHGHAGTGTAAVTNDGDVRAAKGFTHRSGEGYSMRQGPLGGAGGEVGHHQQPQPQHSHKAVGAGEGTFLGRGTVRGDQQVGATPGAVHGGQEQGDEQSRAGLGAAKQAWGGQHQG